MGRVSFKPENKLETPDTFPKLRLKKHEKARIVCIEEPVVEYVHDLRAPKIEDGEVCYELKEKKDGSTYEAIKMDWLGNPLCLGDLGTLEDKGLDPDNCPACAEAKKSDDVKPPKRRFAMHVLRYATKSNGFEVTDPFTVNVVVWSFTDQIFNKLTDIATEWGSLADHDLNLGPCTEESYQKFEITVAREAAWQKTEDRKKNAMMAFKENQCSDLNALCGKKMDRSWMIERLKEVALRWRMVNSAEASTTNVSNHNEFAAGLADLTSSEPKKNDSLASALSVEEAPAPPALAVSDDSGSAPVSFEDLLKELGD